MIGLVHNLITAKLIITVIAAFVWNTSLVYSICHIRKSSQRSDDKASVVQIRTVNRLWYKRFHGLEGGGAILFFRTFSCGQCDVMMVNSVPNLVRVQVFA